MLELAGWPYPKHLAGRVYGLVVHGDVAGIEGTRASLSDWLDWMGLVDAGSKARLERFIGYYEPYATSHDTLDRDEAVQEEVRNVARAVGGGGRRPARESPLDAGCQAKESAAQIAAAVSLQTLFFSTTSAHFRTSKQTKTSLCPESDGSLNAD